MAWVSSKEFVEIYNLNKKSVEKACFRANALSKKICKVKCHYIHFLYTQGRGGNSGKVLKIWDQPFYTQEEAQNFYEMEVLKCKNQTILTQGDQRLQVSLDSLTSSIKPKIADKSYYLAKEKEEVLQEWEKAKKIGIRAKDFIYALNAKGIYSFELSENKLFAWLKAYREGGLESLRDERGKNRLGVNKIKELGLEDEVISLIKARAKSGSINIGSMHHALHILAHQKGLFDFQVFNSKRGELVSYSVLRRFVQEWLKSNPMSKKLILKGSDAVTGSFAPAIGEAKRGTEVNEIVEIDGTSLDLIIDAKEYAQILGVSVEGEWQKRFVLIQLIDTYSKVRSFFICESENKLGVARAMLSISLNLANLKSLEETMERLSQARLSKNALKI